jgi:hypothetical protein
MSVIHAAFLDCLKYEVLLAGFVGIGQATAFYFWLFWPVQRAPQEAPLGCSTLKI